MLIGIDGGMTSPAVAVYSSDGTLHLKDVRSRLRPLSKRPTETSVQYVTRRLSGVMDAVQELLDPFPQGQVGIVYEYPFTPGLRSAKSVATMGLSTGCILGYMLHRFEHSDILVTGVMPATWQKPWPKAKCFDFLHERGAAPAEITDDMLSATGLLLWATDGDLEVDKVSFSW